MSFKLLGLSFILTLLLSFSQTIYADKNVLMAGAAKTDITPTESLYMGGYDESMRDVPSEGAYHKIYIRAVVFDDGAKKIAFVVSDLVFYNDYNGLRKTVSDATGIPYDNIFLSTTHNHAAPTIGGKNADSEWSKGFNSKVVLTVQNAIKDCEPVMLGGGTGHSTIGMNRRKMMEDTVSYTTFDENNSSQSSGKFKTDKPVLIHEMAGVYRLGANPKGSIDNNVGIIRIDTLNGKPKAILVNYACHGTSLGGRNHIISPEWMGHMLEYIENNIPGVTGVYLQGAAGDVNPRFVGGLDGAVDDVKKTELLGNEIGQETVKVFGKIKPKKLSDSQIYLVKKDIECPLKYNVVMRDFKTTTIGVPTAAIKIDNFTFVTFPGEMFHEIGQQIKSAAHTKNSFIVGYCNGSLGYMPTQKAFSEGGYEPNSSRYDPVTEKIYVKEVAKLLNELDSLPKK